MRFRRKAAEPSVADEVAPEPTPIGPGPHDISDVDDLSGRVDLGGLLIPPAEGTELRLQVDEASGQVQSVLVAGPEGAVELRAFAAPRNGDLWAQTRKNIAADVAQRGGTATEREGRWGPELMCEVTVRRPDGSPARQPSRVAGINGSRWMLRATFLGQPALQPDDADAWETVVESVVVRRGSHAMPVGDPIAVTLPAEARRIDVPERD